MQTEVEIINRRQFFLRVKQPPELQCHFVAGIKASIHRKLVFLLIQKFQSNSAGGNYLIVRHTVFLDLDNVPSCGKSAYGYSAILRYGNTFGGKTVKGHFVSNSGT